MKFIFNKKYVTKFATTTPWHCTTVSPLGTAILEREGKELFVPASSTDWLTYREPLAGDYYVLLWYNVLDREPMIQQFITADYTKYSDQKKRIVAATDLTLVHDHHQLWSESEVRK